jgi:hypothetical protein
MCEPRTVSHPTRLIFNQPSFTLELWLRPKALIASSIPSVIVSSAYLPDQLRITSVGYMMLIDPCGALSVWLGTGDTVDAFNTGARLTASLTKSCSTYLFDVANAKFPWLVLSTSVVANQWQHIAVSHSHKVGHSVLFRNGEPVSFVHNTARPYVPNVFSDMTVGASIEAELLAQRINGESW